MSLGRIKTLLWHNWYFQKRSLEAWVDVFWWSIIFIVVFGFLAIYFAQNNLAKTQMILMGTLFWEIARVSQISISIGVLRDIWSRNLSNLFTTPMTTAEFVISQFIVGGIKSVVVFIVVSCLALFVFHFSIFQLGPELAVHFINLLIFSWTAGLIINGLIFRYGNKIQAFAWSIFYPLQPLTAVFYPLSVLPAPMQKLALMFPLTYIFEGARFKLFTGHSHVPYLIIATVMNLVYFGLAYIYFMKMFARARRSGSFARLES